MLMCILVAICCSVTNSLRIAAMSHLRMGRIASRSSRSNLSMGCVDLLVFRDVLRTHDSPMLRQSNGENKICAVYLRDEGVNVNYDSRHLNAALVGNAESQSLVLNEIGDVNDLTHIIKRLKENEGGDVNIRMCYSRPKVVSVGDKSRLITEALERVAVESGVEQVVVEDTMHCYRSNSNGRANANNANLNNLKEDIDKLGGESLPYYSKLKNKLYSRSAIKTTVPLPDLFKTKYSFLPAFSNAQKFDNTINTWGNIEGDLDMTEKRALSILKEYIELGDNAFTLKYADVYVKLAAQTDSHTRSMQRLIKEDISDTAFFYGEVLSGILSPFLSLGLISPRLLIHARSLELSGKSISESHWDLPTSKLLVSDRPIDCRLKVEAVRKDWQKRVHDFTISQAQAQAQAQAQGSQGPSGNKGYDEVSYHETMNGYLERTGIMRCKTRTRTSDSDSDGDGDREGNKTKQKQEKEIPLLVLVHGFGGSMDQMSALGVEMAKSHFDVLGVDLVGFGRSEKPPVSYNQYFWRDQVIIAINRHLKQEGGKRRDVLVAGNSIGGFTAASVAAAFADPVGTGTTSLTENALADIKGLVLMNSAGKIIDLAQLDGNSEPSKSNKNKSKNKSKSKSWLSPEDELNLVSHTEDASGNYSKKFYPFYSGPGNTILRLFGGGLIAALQPQIRKTTEWLYPTYPGRISSSGLDTEILRDSQDIGSPDVMAAGAKLPAPVSMNVLLGNSYLGPVLISQGALDPLNDAPARAAMFGQIRTHDAQHPIKVDLLQLGHCPMDESAEGVAMSIRNWWMDSCDTHTSEMA